MMWRAKGDHALDSRLSAVGLHIPARDQAPLAVSNNVELVEPVGLCQVFYFLRNHLCAGIDGMGVEAGEEPPKSERHHRIVIKTEPIFHGVPDVSSLEKAMKEKHNLSISEIISANHVVAVEVDLPDTSKLVAERTIGRPRHEETGNTGHGAPRDDPTYPVNPRCAC